MAGKFFKSNYLPIAKNYVIGEIGEIGVDLNLILSNQTFRESSILPVYGKPRTGKPMGIFL